MVRRWLVGLLLMALAGVALVSPAAHADPPPAGSALAEPPLRILVYGDSITQGSSGDWTWRYRLWKHLDDGGTTVDFVGPRHGLHHLPAAAEAPDEDTYAGGAFDSDSGAVWGQALALPTYDLANTTDDQDLVTDYRPDVVVGLIGFNDLRFLGETPEQVVDLWRTKIEAARANDPGVDVVLVPQPDVWYDGFADYNDRLAALAADLDTADARVVAAAVPAFARDRDTWDGIHPTATGEVAIARVVEDALSSIGVGPPAGMVPVVANGPSRAGTLAATAGLGQASLSWNDVPGVLEEHLERRDLTRGGAWYRYPYPFAAGTHSWTAGGLSDGHAYEFRLRPAKGTAISDVVTSNVVRVSPGVPAEVTGVVATPGPHRLTVTWRPAALATTYALTWRQAGSAATVHRVTVVGRSTRLDGLVAGQRYVVAVAGARGTIQGPVSGSVTATPTGPRPAAPRLRRLTAGPGARLTVRWAASRSATAYVVGVRDVTAGRAWRWVRRTSAATRAVTLTSRVRGHRYAVRVRADHQLLRGGTSAPRTVTIPRATRRHARAHQT